MESRIGRPASMPTCAIRAGLQEICRSKPGAGCLQTEPGKALEDDPGEVVPVADEVGEDADEQRLLDEPGDDVSSAPQPRTARRA